MKILIFYGPSITASEVTQLTSAAHAPPIKRGDLNAVDDYAVIVILDGEFGQNLSISPKEILMVIERGKVVIGASSMGALRASELDRSGMIGVGWVYNHFRRCAVRRDGDVALAYSPVDFRPITIPLVDVEYWVSLLLTAGRITRKEKVRFVRTARSIFFADRTEERLIKAFRQSFGAELVDSLLNASGGAMPSVKTLDAQAAIRLAASMQQEKLRSAPPGPAW